MKKVSVFKKIFFLKAWMYDFIKITGGIFVLIDLRMKKMFYQGKEKGVFKNAFFLACNHTSYIDPVVAMATVPLRRLGFVTTKELFENKHSNWWFRRFLCVPIDKNNPSIKTFREVNERVLEGHPMCIFPEGAVSLDGNMHEFKPGLLFMAYIAKTDIVPMYIVKREKRIKRQVVVIGHRLKINELVKSTKKEDLEEASKILRSKMDELKDYYESKQNKKHERKMAN